MEPLSRTRPGAARAARRRPSATRHVFGNLGARLVALVSVALVTVLVARSGGAEDVGLLALMRVLPGVVGVVSACGLPGAMGFFIGGSDGDHPRLWPTVHTLMVLGGLLGTAVWMLFSVVIHEHLMTTTTFAVVVLTGVTVATQLPVAVGKASLQALGDTRGSNVVTAAEEAAFVPVYLLLWWAGARSGVLLVVSLLVADVLVAALAWHRLARGTRGHALVGRYDLALARRMTAFGMRAQVGGVLSLLNLRLDVIILGALAGPAQVGVYVVASKLAELLRLPALALTWVTYPQFARSAAGTDVPAAEAAVSGERAPDGTDVPGARADRATAAARAPASARTGAIATLEGLPSLPKLLALGAILAAVVAASGFVVLPFLYGDGFESARWPAAWIALGLLAEPAAGVGSGFLLGTGRPGLNSAILGAGFVVTLALDIALIPAHGSNGAAWASAAAYLVTDVLLVWAWYRLRKDE
ncbi:lipopolysaccharide biosynthesis protein [Terrabacter sp. MAHUQ-38]|uniref:lipopolysaccharide biosynthesis protein n=1 Tax=unclassified Terrabacter TaxID=2630222 RepID=UPI00165E859D|nr:polysaccharide biosynthesis C-terminal domain-containing protein [Terrabacter sp. MAHUQ-38]MBC9822412.1 polysaccharide biosynthesis C-terminal domain-containing protein [Terrabacter sp. MAHUQ-38]